MHVLIIGPDNSGKSTLAAKLKETIQATHLKAIHLDDDQLTLDTVAKYLTTIGSTDGLTIWDRWHYPDDMIYNPIVARRHSKLSPHVAFIEAMLNSANSMILFVTADAEDLFMRLGQRGDDYITPDMYQAILSNYATFIQNTKLPVYTINTSNHDEYLTHELARMMIEQFYEERTGKLCKWLL